VKVSQPVLFVIGGFFVVFMQAEPADLFAARLIFWSKWPE